MTIAEAIAMLEKLKNQHGPDTIQLFFDCPSCNLSFTPSTVATTAVHIAAERKP